MPSVDLEGGGGGRGGGSGRGDGARGRRGSRGSRQRAPRNRNEALRQIYGDIPF